jgi:chorismate mutase
LKKCFDIKMRKDWIRTDEERELRQLQKLAKEQKKLNNPTNDQQSFLNFQLTVRKKKRLMIKPFVPQVLPDPVITTD